MERIATRTMVFVLVSQGRLREALAMARDLLASSGSDPQLDRTVKDIESRLQSADPFFSLTADGRTRIRTRFEGLLARIASRRRGAAVIAPFVEPPPPVPAAIGPAVAPAPPVEAEPAPAMDETGVVLPDVAATDDFISAVVLNDITSGVASAGVSYEAEAAPVVETQRELSPTELRSRKLRLLEDLTDRINRRKRGS